MNRQNLRFTILTTLIASALSFQVGNVFAEGGDKPAATEEKSESLLDKMKGMVGLDDESAADESKEEAASEAKEAASEAQEAVSEGAESTSEAAEAASDEAAEKSENLQDKAKTMMKGE